MLRVAMILAFLAVSSANIHDRAYYEAKFFDWLSEHKVAARSASHFVQMLTNFANNDDIIEAHNAKNLSYTLGHNQFSHMTQDEWREYVKLGLMRPEPSTAAEIHEAVDVSNLADSIDWTTKGAVTPVKDQGQCGSCWSFSTTGAIEGAYQIKNRNLISFSEQELVSCDTKGQDAGCNGGWMDDAFTFAKSNGGLPTEADYPYTSGTTGKSGSCEANHSNVAGSAPSGYVDVTAGSVSALQSAVAKQPVSIAIQANQPAFQLYKSGVLTGKCGQRLDHGVLLVGYGTDGGNDYWKVKNSWGDSWGESGYIRILRSNDDLCGVLDAASYPTY